MPINEYLPFAYAGGANVVTQEEYEAMTARAVGFNTGVAKSPELNKAWRQASVMASAIAEFIMDTSGVDVLDNGDRDALSALFVTALEKKTRKQLADDLDIYVSPSGDDVLNDGLSFAKPVKTLQRAWNIAFLQYDFNNYSLIIHVANGTYTAPLNMYGTPVGMGNASTITVEGNVASPSSVLLSVTLTQAIGINQVVPTVILRGIRITATGTPGTYNSAGCGLAVQFAACLIDSVHFHTCGGWHMSVWQAGLIFTNKAPYSITGGAQQHMAAFRAGSFVIVQSPISVVGNPTFTVFASAHDVGNMEVYENVYTGTAVGQRYNASMNGTIIANGGANYFPGTIAGAVSTGGQYI